MKELVGCGAHILIVQHSCSVRDAIVCSPLYEREQHDRLKYASVFLFACSISLFIFLHCVQFVFWVGCAVRYYRTPPMGNCVSSVNKLRTKETRITVCDHAVFHLIDEKKRKWVYGVCWTSSSSSFDVRVFLYRRVHAVQPTHFNSIWTNDRHRFLCHSESDWTLDGDFWSSYATIYLYVWLDDQWHSSLLFSAWKA